MLFSLFVAGALTLQSAQSAKPEKAAVVLSRAVPKDALFLLQIRGLDSLRADFEAGAWYGFYQDEEMKGFRGWLAKEIAEESTKKEGALDLDPWAVVQSLHGSIAMFGVVKPTKKEPSIGILIDPGEPRAPFDALLAKVADHWKQTRAAAAEDYSGVAMQLFAKKAPAENDSPDADKPDLDLEHAALFEVAGATCIVFAESREELTETAHGLVDRMRSKDSAGGIEGSALLTEARASVAKSGRFEALGDFARVVQTARAEHAKDEKAGKVADALGVDGLRWIYATGDLGKGEAITFDVTAKIPEKGYLHDWAGFLGKISSEMAGKAPRDSAAITIYQFDVWGLWQSAWKLFAEIDAAGAEKAKEAMNSALDQYSAGDLEKDLVAQLDGRFMSFNVAVPASEWTAQFGAAAKGTDKSTTGALGSATVVGLRDAQVVGEFLDEILKGIGMSEMVKTEEVQGTTVHAFSMGPGIAMQWAFTKNAAIFAQLPTAMREALRMQTAEKKDSALEKESFKPLFAAHADAGVLSLAATPESFKMGLSALKQMSGMLAGFSGGADSPLRYLPSPESVDRHFKGTMVSTVSRTGGVLHIQFYSR
ncbi:MAG TPA: hypothetical protein VGR31_11905 [Planctomycetota bacterium]|jgi:hypothetical protein|nr:hypothetical protein [Planctomycetota bacterium]